MTRTAQQTIEAYYDNSIVPSKPGAGHVDAWAWLEESGELYDREAHLKEIAEEARYQAEVAGREAHRVSLEDQILEALQRGDRAEARRLISSHYRAEREADWCGDPNCCS